MEWSNEGLSLWFGTEDAPGPREGAVIPREGAALIVGVRPVSPLNVVAVHYRIDGGALQTAVGREIRVAGDRQYFRVLLPTLPAGDVLEYAPFFRLGGRQVPSATVASPRVRVKLAPAPTVRDDHDGRHAPPAAPMRQAPVLTFMADVSIHFARIDFIGETPEGVRVDFIADRGLVYGPALRGTVLPGAADHMVIRSDGIGCVDVRAVIATDDGAKLEVEDTGYVDFGLDGYAAAQKEKLPAESTLIIHPRILTGDPRYRALNRLQYLGIGRTNLAASSIDYQLYSVRAELAAGRNVGS